MAADDARESRDGPPRADELDDGEALQAAARAGILLLEQNHELQEENAALREQVAVLERERPTLRTALAARDEELAALREERRRSLLEANALRSEVKAQSGLVTELLDRERRLRGAAEDAEAAREVAEARADALQRAADELQRREAAADASAAGVAARSEADGRRERQAAEREEEAVARWREAVASCEALQRELDGARGEGDALRRKAARLADAAAQLERAEKRGAKLQAANDALHEELEEERAVLESLRTMNLMYKQLADARPFAPDEAAAGDSNSASTSASAPAPASVTLQDVLLETNLQLETEVRELKLALARALPDAAGSDNNGGGSDDGGGSDESGGGEGEARDGDKADPLGPESGAEAEAARLVRRVQELEEKLRVAKDVIKHAKLHWSAAVASQKALEECNRDAQEELARLTQQLDYYVSLATSSASSAGGAQGQSSLSPPPAPAPEDERWVEEQAPYPAPPGDLNSPLIKCLLDHWTTDKAQVMMLTDWLHNAIRGTGRPTGLHLPNLSSEVAAGFSQLLVPILRERHGVSVTIYRRDSLQILSDLLLQTNRPSGGGAAAVPEFSTDAADASASAAGAATSSGPSDAPVQAPTPAAAASAARRGRSARRKRGSSPFLKGEAQFLYG